MTLSAKRLTLLLVALFAALALIVAGCGGDGDDNAATTAAAETEATTAESDDGEQATDEDADEGAGEGPGEGTDEGNSAEPSTDAGFVAAVTEICERAQKESEQAGINDEMPLDENADPEAFADEIVNRFNKIKGIFNGAIDELGEVTPPAANESDYEEFLTTNRRLMELSEQAISAFAKDPEHMMSEEDMQEQQKLGANYDRLLKKLGIPGGCFNDAA